MSRPLRIEFPGAIYHVTSRGDRREPIYRDDDDRIAHLNVLAEALDRFDAQALAYCLMGNHYHLVLHTRQANLSRLMRHFNGVYTQAFNRRHALSGHLFQGRFKAILVDRDAYLLEVCRYVELNPVRAKMVAAPLDWAWSSYGAHVGQEATPPWLDTAGLHGYLLGRPAKTGADQTRAAQRYAALVAEGKDVRLWDDRLRQQIYLGDDDFVARMQALAEPQSAKAAEVPRQQRQVRKSFAQCLAECGGQRDAALLMAYRSHGLTMTALARETGLSVSRVSRIVGQQEEAARQ